MISFPNSHPALEGQNGEPDRTTPYRGVRLFPSSPGPAQADPTQLRFADEEEAAWFEERAAIREFDGGLSRDAAERLAWFDLTQARLAIITTADDPQTTHPKGNLP